MEESCACHYFKKSSKKTVDYEVKVIKGAEDLEANFEQKIKRY